MATEVILTKNDIERLTGKIMLLQEVGKVVQVLNSWEAPTDKEVTQSLSASMGRLMADFQRDVNEHLDAQPDGSLGVY